MFVRHGCILATLAVCASTLQAGQVTVTIENLAPSGGTYITPVWVGFHDGSFDLYDMGSPASPELERLAEDGNTGPLSDLFSTSGAGTVQGTIVSDGIPPLSPGEMTSMTFDVESDTPYFSYASMVIPSNDAFIANGDPIAHRLFDNDGNFVGANFFVVGNHVLDAGTEMNDELPMNTAFLGQMTPDTGTTEGGVVMPHAGFLAPGQGGILDHPDFANADFTNDGYPIAQIRVTPEPATLVMLASGALAFSRRRRKAGTPVG